MKKLILGIGIPASGKSTFLERFAQDYNFAYICTDIVRAEFEIERDDPLAATDNAKTFAVWDEIRLRTGKFLMENKSVIVDATFAKPELRKEFIEIGSNFGAKIVGLFMDTSPKIAWKRNLSREHKVPKKVFVERVQQLLAQPPRIEDGFNTIFTLSENGLIRAQNGSIKYFGEGIKI